MPQFNRMIAGIEKLSRVSEQQSKTLDEQREFTRILALATLILAIVAFLNFFDLKLPLSELFGTKIIDVLLMTFGFTFLLFIFILVLKITYNLFFRKKK